MIRYYRWLSAPMGMMGLLLGRYGWTVLGLGIGYGLLCLLYGFGAADASEREFLARMRDGA